MGTVLMDLVWYRRYRGDGGKSRFLSSEFALEVKRWEDAPGPAQVGRLIARTVGQDISLEHAAAVNNVMHWGYGVSVGAAYALLFGDRRRGRLVAGGPLWGAAVGSSSYVTLPLLGVYETIWRYDARTLWRDLSAHLMFGTGVGAAAAVVRAR